MLFFKYIKMHIFLFSFVLASTSLILFELREASSDHPSYQKLNVSGNLIVSYNEKP